MKRFIVLLLLGFISFNVTAQKAKSEKPKLVVGIVVDQMRYDYLTRFWDRFSEDGFKKLATEGFNFKNNHFNYIPTYTGPGHASVYTGTSPMNHGIIGNGWYDKFNDAEVYCVADDNVEPIGTMSVAGKMSPHRLKSTTFGDQNRLHTQLRGKTIGVALKDRGAILPAGHAANAAYWFHGKDEGKWITSSYYMKELPSWVKNFNRSEKVKFYLKTWNTLYDIDTYTESGIDTNKFERGFYGKDEANFPYELNELSESNMGFDIIKETPFGNDLTTDFAMAAIVGEDLGDDDITDVLTVSYSSTDYIGHNFGVNSKEVEDAYLRLDLSLAKLLKFLDDEIGEDEYTIFLTADHGGVDVPAYLKSVGIPAGYFKDVSFIEDLSKFTEEEFKEKDLIKNVSNGQVFLNYDAIFDAKINMTVLEDRLAHFILQQEQVDKVYTRTQLEGANFTNGIAAGIQNGFNQKRSGDIIFVLDPATIIYPETGSTHGSGFMYDTHAPLLFYGKGIKQGSTTSRSEIIDIAPSIAALLGISFPNAATGNPLHMMLDADDNCRAAATVTKADNF